MYEYNLRISYSLWLWVLVCTKGFVWLAQFDHVTSNCRLFLINPDQLPASLQSWTLKELLLNTASDGSEATDEEEDRQADAPLLHTTLLHHYDDQSVDTLMLNLKAEAMNMIDVIIHFLAKILKPGRPGESYSGSCSKSNGITFRWSSHRTGWCQRKLVRKNSGRLDYEYMDHCDPLVIHSWSFMIENPYQSRSIKKWDGICMELVYRFCLFVAHVKSWYPWQAQKFTCSGKRHTGRDCIVCSWYFLGIWMLTLHIPTAVHDCFPFAIQYCSFYSGVVSHKMMDLPRNAGLKTLYTHQHVRLVFFFNGFLEVSTATCTTTGFRHPWKIVNEGIGQVNSQWWSIYQSSLNKKH